MKKIKLYLLTGFLGSGKTTFLKTLLEENTDKRIGIIMNEFGKVGIDGGLVSNHTNELIEINRGSIFCSCLKLSFVESLKEMSDKNVDILFVEGSGLADPSNIGEILEATEILVGDRYDYSGSICVVDALNFIDQAKDIETLERQIKHSHIAVISKLDLIDNLDEITTLIHEYNSNIQIEVTDFGKLNFNLLTEWEKDITIIKDETTNKTENKPKTLSLDMFEPVKKDNFEAFLKALSKDAYRMKGFVDFVEEGMKQVDIVGNTIDYKSTDETTTQLVIISKIGPAIIKPIMNSWQELVQTEFKLKN